MVRTDYELEKCARCGVIRDEHQLGEHDFVEPALPPRFCRCTTPILDIARARCQSCGLLPEDWPRASEALG
jgi:hypothetical protein